MVPKIILQSGTIIFKKMFKVLLCWIRLFTRGRLGAFILFTIIVILGIHPLYWIFRKPLCLQETRRILENRSMEYCLQEKGQGCERPKLDPFAPEVMEFSKDVPKVICNDSDWIVCKKSECYVTQEILNNITDVSCTYKDIIYVNDQEYFLSDYTIVNGEDKYKLNRSDHVKVSCTGRYKYGYSLFSPRWEGVKIGLRPVKTLPIPPNRKDSYNVMILGFDSVSHYGFIRKMPKSYKYLTENAITMNGYNVVGDGTPAALFPILTGKPEEEHPDSRKKITKNIYMDHKSFIFHMLKRYGYHTAYLEEQPEIGTFQYRFNGFQHQPADHYLRAALLEDKNLFREIMESSGIFSVRYCIGATPSYDLLMKLSDELFQLDGQKFCFTFLSTVSHNGINEISMADDSLLSFMESWSARHVLEDTLLIIMGDHGSRFSKLRETYQGKLEERLPLLSIFLPEKLKRLRPDAVAALNQNVDKVTTPFDLHTTILDVLNLKDLSNKYTIPGCELPRALSLLEPIPATRSCADAGIAPHWCTCTKWRSLSRSSPMFEQVANALAEYINTLTSELRLKCERREITSVASVLRQSVDDQLLKYVNYKEEDAFFGNPQASAPRARNEYYMATIIMTPGRAVFEATVMYNTQNKLFTFNKNEISRINAYKNEPHCISATHPHLNPFCYCKEIL